MGDRPKLNITGKTASFSPQFETPTFLFVFLSVFFSQTCDSPEPVAPLVL